MKKVFSYLNEKTKGLKLLILALIAALPDIIDVLVGLDWSALGLEPGTGAKVGLAITVLRIVMGAVSAKMKTDTEKADKAP